MKLYEYQEDDDGYVVVQFLGASFGFGPSADPKLDKAFHLGWGCRLCLYMEFSLAARRLLLRWSGSLG